MKDPLLSHCMNHTGRGLVFCLWESSAAFLFLKIIESIDYITGKIWRNMTVESNRIT